MYRRGPEKVNARCEYSQNCHSFTHKNSLISLLSYGKAETFLYIIRANSVMPLPTTPIPLPSSTSFKNSNSDYNPPIHNSPEQQKQSGKFTSSPTDRVDAFYVVLHKKHLLCQSGKTNDTLGDYPTHLLIVWCIKTFASLHNIVNAKHAESEEPRNLRTFRQCVHFLGYCICE